MVSVSGLVVLPAVAVLVFLREEAPRMEHGGAWLLASLLRGVRAPGFKPALPHGSV